MPARDESGMTTSLPYEQDDLFERLDSTSFDPVLYLNESLPALTLTTQTSSATKQNRSTLLQGASTDIQTFLSKLSTHNIRSSSELTGLTDEILRSGNRLAYEVEVLRGDTNNLYELLTDTLREDISQFVRDTTTPTKENEIHAPEGGGEERRDPEFIRQLRISGLVKARLEAVISVFGESMKWPIPPSEVSIASSLISVSNPEFGVANSAEDDIAREYTRRIRSEITALLDSDGGGYTGLESGTKRVDQFKSLSEVWKGTAEEKARMRVVEGLIKLIEDRKRTLDARSATNRSNMEGTVKSNIPGRAGRIVEGSSNTAAGFFRKLRDDIYLD